LFPQSFRMHPDILEINPSFELPEQLDFYGNPVKDPSFPIKVAHRSGASGTTNTFTSYLHKACPEHWGGDLFGSDIEWPMAGGDSLIPTGGTSGMINVLSSGEEGVIGYSDAGSALATGLDEAALKVEESSLKGDFFLTAENALTKNGVAAALGATNIPESGDVDWSGVDTVNNVEVRAAPSEVCNSARSYLHQPHPLTIVSPRHLEHRDTCMRGRCRHLLTYTCAKISQPFQIYVPSPS
jgi:ABC-type phosphate transport system substrate-binding protein